MEAVLWVVDDGERAQLAFPICNSKAMDGTEANRDLWKVMPQVPVHLLDCSHVCVVFALSNAGVRT